MKLILLLAAGGAAYLWYTGAKANPSGNTVAQLQSGWTVTKAAIGIPCCDGCAKGNGCSGGQTGASGGTPAAGPQPIMLGAA